MWLKECSTGRNNTMILRWSRVVVFLVIVVVSLQMLHMVLLTQLEQRNGEIQQLRYKRNVEEYARKASEMMTGMVEQIKLTTVTDYGGEYSIINSWVKSKQESWRSRSKVKVTESVTITTHCSIELLHHLVELSLVWMGPISVVVFAPEMDALVAMETVTILYHCVPAIADNVTIHLVFPLVSSITDYINSNLPNISTHQRSLFPCDNLKGSLSKVIKTRHKNYDRKKYPYPNNLLRNVALRNAQTEFRFPIDIDMVPNLNLLRDFNLFIKNNKRTVANESTLDRTVFVVPAFEVQKGEMIPATKEELLRMWSNMQIQPFYFEQCFKCQRNTDYERWKDLDRTSEFKVAYELSWKDPWEPFYIASKDIPLYDERFRQYGFNRISQTCELHVAGYRFAVLNHAFVVHKGFKKPDSFHASKNQELEKNRMLFRQFKKELKNKYPDSTRRCY